MPDYSSFVRARFSIFFTVEAAPLFSAWTITRSKVRIITLKDANRMKVRSKLVYLWARSSTSIRMIAKRVFVDLAGKSFPNWRNFISPVCAFLSSSVMIDLSEYSGKRRWQRKQRRWPAAFVIHRRVARAASARYITRGWRILIESHERTVKVRPECVHTGR